MTIECEPIEPQFGDLRDEHLRVVVIYRLPGEDLEGHEDLPGAVEGGLEATELEGEEGRWGGGEVAEGEGNRGGVEVEGGGRGGEGDGA